MDSLSTVKAIQRSVGLEPDGVVTPELWAAISRALGISERKEEFLERHRATGPWKVVDAREPPIEN